MNSIIINGLFQLSGANYIETTEPFGRYVLQAVKYNNTMYTFFKWNIYWNWV